MKTHLFLIGALSVLGTSLLTTSYAASPSEYLHFTRHRDSNGNLLMAPAQHQAEPSVMQKTMMPSQPKTLERRSTDWGMSVQEVKENEPIQFSWELQSPVLSDDEQRVAYHTQIEGVEAALTYTFYEDHLGQAKYVFEPQHDDAVDYVQDFHTLKNWISQSYGLPTSVQEIWLDKLYQYDESLWGQAVLRGHLAMVAEWKNPGTDIVLMLNGGDDTVGLVADFSSTTFVVPVSFDAQNPEGNVREVIEEATSQEALSADPMENPVVDEVSIHDMSEETEGSGEFHPEAEVASQGSVNEIQELEEIEQMLNKEFPVNEPPTKEFPVNKPLTKEFPLIESVEPAMEGGSMGKGKNEAVSEETAIEPSVELQSPERAKMPLESSSKESATEAQPTDKHADDHAMEEHANDHVMETEEELDPQHL